MVEWVLRLFDLFAPLLRAAGVDPRRFRALLGTRLVMDDRRPLSGAGTRYAADTRRSFRINMVVFACFGAAAGFAVILVDSPFTALTLVNGFIMIMVGLSLVADFTNVLVDTRENGVILPRPVDDRTLFAARAAHITVYLGALSLSLSLFTLVAGAVRYHPAFLLLYPLMLAAAMALTLFLVFLFFLALLRVMNLERFRDVILWFQVVMTVAVFAGYNLLPRLMAGGALKGLRLEECGWIGFLPPAWTAAPVTLLTGGVDGRLAAMMVPAVVLPPLCLFVVFRFLAPGFNRTLARLEHLASGRPSLRDALPARIAGLLSRVPGRPAEEEAALRWIWAVASRDRAFKRAVYPMVALVIVGTAAFLLAGRGDEGMGKGLFSDRRYLFPLYFLCFLSPFTLVQLSFSDQHEGAWLYHALPIRLPGAVLAAALRVVMIRFLLPMFLVVAGGVILFWGPRVFPDLLLAFLFLLSFSTVYAFLSVYRFPFSEGRSAKNASGQAMRTLGLMFLVGLAATGHYALTGVPYGTWMPMPFLFLLAASAYRRYARTSWWRMYRARVLE